MQKGQFTIRVYGILIRKDQVLLVHETMPELSFTKFPGGGMEWGEGTRDCLVREFKEETGLDIRVENHIYTTDFFQPSAFRKGDQLIAIYYKVSLMNLTDEIPEGEQVIEINGNKEVLKFYWKNLKDLDPDEDLTFPVDKIVARIFLENS